MTSFDEMQAMGAERRPLCFWLHRLEKSPRRRHAQIGFTSSLRNGERDRRPLASPAVGVTVWRAVSVRRSPVVQPCSMILWSEGVIVCRTGCCQCSNRCSRAQLHDPHRQLNGAVGPSFHLKPRNPRIARTITIAPTHQMMLFIVYSSQPNGNCQRGVRFWNITTSGTKSGHNRRVDDLSGRHTRQPWQDRTRAERDR